MPVNAEMMSSMLRKYGKEKGEKIYYAIENKLKNKLKLKKKKLGSADRIANRLRSMAK